MEILVILAAYNGVKHIEDQVCSILNQNETKITLLVFDDRSNDGTIKLLTTKFSSNNRVKIVVNSVQSGSAANNFLQAIKIIDENIIDAHDYIAFADQDDIWLPNKLKAASNLLLFEKSDLYMSNLTLWEEKKNKKSIINKSFSQKKYDYLFEGGSAGCTYVFSKNFGKELKKKLYDINYKDWQFFSHDRFVYFFARIQNYKVVIDRNSYILYRVHDTNVHGQMNVLSLHAIEERLKLILNGWYFKQLDGFIQLLDPSSTEYKIYQLYSRNFFTRFWVLIKYNSHLIRSKRKFVIFAFISMLPRFRI